MNNILSYYLPHLCVALSSVAFGLLFAFYFEWRTALISIGLIPLIGISGAFQSSLASGYLNESLKQY
jgi:ABC-type transport system involved in cytochrome bd biosynthesis fused ATPase/permease subunit